MDGSLDGSFTSPFNAQNSVSTYEVATVRAIQPDGKVLVSVFTYVPNSGGETLYRLNADGTKDAGFTPIAFTYSRTQYDLIAKVVLMTNGKIAVATNVSAAFRSARFRRFNSDGTRDTSFEEPTLTGSLPSAAGANGYYISDFEALSDQSVIIVGAFDTINSVNRKNTAKLGPAGNVDLSFSPTANSASGVEIFSNGKILTSNGSKFILYNADGSADNSFIQVDNLTSIRKFVIDGAGNIFFNGDFTENDTTVNKFVRLNMNGVIIASFAPNLGISGIISALALQTDGKVIVVGDFTSVGAAVRINVARLNNDGSLDESFNVVSQNNDQIAGAFVQPDGKILLTGSFTTNTISGLGIKRVNADGSVDASFNPNIEAVVAVVIQSDGKILVGGGFTTVNGQTQFKKLARLNADGTLDTSFNPIFGTSGSVNSLTVQSDGKILVGGTFTGVNGFSRSNLVRLNADGSLDTTFNAGSISSTGQIARQADGKYIVNLFSRLVRLNVDGTTDNTFQSLTTGSLTINAFSIMPDGSIIIGGSFAGVGGFPRARLARLRNDGTVDSTFFPTGANNTINALIRQADNKLLIGGSFTAIDNTVRLGVARIVVNQVVLRVTPYDYDGDGRADISVFRPSNGFWYLLGSQSGAFSARQFGQSGDQIVPADYDGDGKTDLAVFRAAAGGAGYFYILNSGSGSYRPEQFGQSGDVPVVGDWDGDGIADLAVYRDGSQTGSASVFYYRPSSAGVNFRQIIWGAAQDRPLLGDFDGDGKLDAAVFRPSNAYWYILKSSDNQYIGVPFGRATDILTPADFNGDGKTDFGVFRPDTGSWYYSSSLTSPGTQFTAIPFGQAGDVPVAADYDGDGRADVAVFRPSNGSWYLNRSTQGFTGIQFGQSGDAPAPNAYNR